MPRPCPAGCAAQAPRLALAPTIRSREVVARRSRILERIFAGREEDFALWRAADEATRRLLWEARTERLKLSTFAEQFFRRLAERLGHAMLLRKGELHRLVEYLPVERIPDEVVDKLDLVAALFASARCEETATG